MRLRAAKLLTILIVTVSVFSHDIYFEGGLIDLSFETAASIVLFVSALGRVWTASYIAGKKNRELITTGPYSLLRHPLYFFTLLGYVGAGLAFRCLTLTALFLVVFLVTHWPAIRNEEQQLARRFGKTYQAYAASTRCLWPDWKNFRTDSEGIINYGVYSRALLDAALIGLIYPGTQVLHWAQLHHLLPVALWLY